MMNCLLICTTLFLPYIFAIPIPSNPEERSIGNQKFLEVYLDKFFPSHHKTTTRSLEERLRDMQKFFHLTVTGRMDRQTRDLMNQPRCGFLIHQHLEL
ncbi:hypothetical protein JRQ81_019637 [Phrynocephalus forsythii]|uniref:Peptidoglycan binding-like domain-containing protein n=1 Tax=Phrynocephalus forsythii TaxID=171643 RepID=A0A9Q0XM93_9SAUR|nr:hypothetical protein JRQ81_019637 [Phrynocephalus forsythii]